MRLRPDVGWEHCRLWSRSYARVSARYLMAQMVSALAAPAPLKRRSLAGAAATP